MPFLLPFAAWLATAQDPAPQPAVPTPRERALAQLRQLGWLAGTWVLQDGPLTTEEHWRPLQGTTLLGTSHTYDASRTRFFEYLRITLVGDQVAYVALPGGGVAATFRLARLADGVVEFEDPEHDHPQRIRYEKTDHGIKATTCQLDGSRAMVFDFKTR
ncbi:MAG: hypothetical protein KF830_07110 [Planctomycetes bacterium]|nr:hypothetical protein [Planctomycetota bacterium]